MNCHFCQAPLPSYNQCLACKTDHIITDDKLVGLRLYVRIKNSILFLYLNMESQTAEFLSTNKYTTLPWEFANRITPQNIKEKLKLYLTFS